MTRTRIVCTIGPESFSDTALESLMDAGMNVARLNFSHGTLEEKAGLIRRIRRLSARRKQPVAILQDLSGLKIRIGTIAHEPAVLKPGASFTLTTRRVSGDDREVSVSYAGLPADVRPGHPILLADGALELAVESVKGPDIRCRVVIGGELTSRKGINLPGGSVRAPGMTRKDQTDLAFGIEQGVDWIALSFVRSAADLERARRQILRAAGDIPLIAKIEKHEAVDRIEEILAAADGIMVARGDLGVEIPLEDVPRVQKLVIEKANRAGKPVITATQMLKSMTGSPRPTRAEVTDVANAILDGADAVMLSEETAVGRYPAESVAMMKRIADRTEADFPFRAWTRKFEDDSDLPPREAIAQAACRLAETIGAAAILTCTQSGATARLVAKYRPAQPILALTPDEVTFRRLSLIWGAIPVRIPKARSVDEMERNALRRVRELGLARSGQSVVLTAGLPLHVPGTTHVVKIATIP